jgi:hypothetical protein
MSGEQPIIVVCKAIYAQAWKIKELYGVPKPTLVKAASEGKIKSRKLEDNPSLVTDRTTRVYCCNDVEAWIENDCVDPRTLTAVADTSAEEVA